MKVASIPKCAIVHKKVGINCKLEFTVRANRWCAGVVCIAVGVTAYAASTSGAAAGFVLLGAGIFAQ